MAFYPQGMTLKALLENPDLLNPPKLTGGNKEKKEKDPDDLDMIFNPQSAFLGPQLWDKTLPYDSNDLKLEYMDLDEFLEENGIPLTEDQSKSNLENARVPHPMLSQSPPQLLGVEGVAVNPRTLSPHPDAYDTSNISALLVGNNDKCESNKAKGEESSLIETVGSTRLNSASRENQSSPVVELNISAMDLALAQIPDLDSEIVSPSLSVSPQSDSNSQDFQLNPDDLALARVEGQEDFDPRERKFSEEELRPQPMIKKAKKIFIDDEAKDDKYWMRRKKNNVAAKRSRDARRIKENQIAMRASFLESQANQLRKELAKSKEENCELRKRLAKYE